jgi:membrane protease YdiL (CAAX protease family)
MVDKNPVAGQGWTIPILVSLAVLLPQLLSLAPRSVPDADGIGTAYLANGMIQSVSQMVLLAIIIGASGRSREFGVQKPRPRDVPAAVLILGGMLLIGRIIALITAILGLTPGGTTIGAPGQPSLPAFPSAPLPSALSPGGILATMASLALATGFSFASAYREELFYRAFVLGSCRQRSAPPAAGVAVSVILFAWGHAYQGPAGLASAALMGLFLAIAWTRGSSVHALAWGHAAYNLGILVTLNK